MSLVDVWENCYYFFFNKIILGPIEMESYPCPQCKRRYRYKRNLSVHLKNECGKDPKFSCPFCQHKTHRKYNLNLHIRHKHNMDVFIEWDEEFGFPEKQNMNMFLEPYCHNKFRDIWIILFYFNVLEQKIDLFELTHSFHNWAFILRYCGIRQFCFSINMNGISWL